MSITLSADLKNTNFYNNISRAQNKKETCIF